MFFRAMATGELQYGVQVQHGSMVNDETKKVCYVIDVDFFRQETVSYGDVEKYLRVFHREAGHFFRACLKPDLYNALGPTPAP